MYQSLYYQIVMLSKYLYRVYMADSMLLEMVSLYSFLKYAINLSTSVFEEITMICFQVMLGKYEEICNKLIKKIITLN